jgi:hypothetical protein
MQSKFVCSLKSAPGNPRNSEGAFIQLRNGQVAYLYSCYHGESWDDHSSAELAVRISGDNGKTWSGAPLTVIRKEPGMLNLMSVSLLRLHSGKIALVYLCKKKNGGDIDCHPVIRFSSDEGQSWSDPRQIIPSPGYYVVNNDRMIQLKNGRLLLPAAFHSQTAGRLHPQAVSCMFYSDDEGACWSEAPQRLYPEPDNQSGFQEPGVVELSDGAVMQWCRTDCGCQYKAFSRNGGLSWSPVVPAPEFPSPLSPLSIKRCPYNGDLYAVWNDHHPDRRVDFLESSMQRTPLVIARSQDDGQTWHEHRILENDRAKGYAYTAMLFLDHSLLLGYCCGSGGNGGNMLQDSCIRKITLPQWTASNILEKKS